MKLSKKVPILKTRVSASLFPLTRINKSIILFSYFQWEKLSVSTAFCVEARKTRYVGEADRLERTAPPEFGRNWEFGPDLVNNVEF